MGVQTIHFVIGVDTRNAANRITRGVKVGSEGPSSPLYATFPDLKAAVDGTNTDTTALKTAVDAYSKAEAAFKTAGQGLQVALTTWDLSYGVLVATAERRCVTAEDGTSLGLVVRGATHNPLAPPLGILLRQDMAKDLLRIRVKRAPGMDAVDVWMSPDPITATSWKQLDGNGALHVVAHPPAGTTWVRAASRRASETSDFTTPDSIVIV
jgi:hypothetical protein